MKQHQATQGGFSLLETLVALVICSMSVVLIFQIYSKGTRAMGLSNDYMQATIIAQSGISGIGLLNDATVGVYEKRRGKYHLTVRVSEPELSENDQALKQSHNLLRRNIEVDVSWQRKGKTRAIQLHTSKLLPAT